MLLGKVLESLFHLPPLSIEYKANRREAWAGLGGWTAG